MAMIAGMSWARWWAGVFMASTAIVFIATQPASFAHWTGWAQLLVLALSPMPLVWARARDEQQLKSLHEQEARKMVSLSEAARSLLAFQQRTQQLEQRIAEIVEVYHVSKETNRALHLSELFASLLEIAPRLLHARGLRLVDLTSSPPQALRATLAADGRMVQPPLFGGVSSSEAARLIEMEQAVIKRLAATGESSSATALELSSAMPQGLTRIAWASLLQEQRPIGVLLADELPEHELKTLSIVANQLALQCSRVHLYQQVETLAVTDALTGLFVRRHFLERAEEEIARSKRHGLSCTLCMVDLDLFKEKNDTFGHLVGDVVLKDVASLLKRNLREVDLIARYGGEEFILLLIETGVEQAMPITERLKQLVEVHPIRAYDELLTQTISMGIAGFPEDGQTLADLIERSDKALYAAKRAGRNRVMRCSS
jgi:diguanylate cyclase (GGDEF)-like protein